MKKILLRLSALSIGLGLMVILSTSTAFAGTTPAITGIAHKNGVNKVLVEFNAPVWSDTTYATGLAATDFQLGGTCGATSISSVAHVAGDDWAILTVAGTIAANESTCTIAAVANNIFTVGGALSEKTLAWDGAPDTTAPTITAATALNGQAEVMVTFSEHVFGEADGTAALVNADFAYDDVAGGVDADACTGTAAVTTLHVAGNNWAVWTCSVALTTAADIDDNEEMDLAGATNVYDLFGNAALAAQNANLAADAGVPTFATGFVATKGEATIGGTKFLVKFSEPVFNATAPALADLANTDFTYNNASALGGTALSGTAQQTNDQKWVLLTVDAAFIAGDLDGSADTIAAVATEIHDAFDQQQATTTMDLQDNTDPVILSLAYNVNAGNQNQFVITYSEKVQITGLTTGGATMAASTTTVGDLAAVGALQGFGDFATNGTITVPTAKNTLAIDSTQTIITITMAGVSGGYIETSTTTITVPSGVFTPEITGDGVKDIATVVNDIEVDSTQSTLTTTTAWDTTRPTISSAVLSDTYYNNAGFVAGGTFNAGSDGRADQVIFTASEALKGSTLTPDAAGTRNDWAITAATGEFGNSLTVIKAAPVTAGDTGTTYTLNFSGAQVYYATPNTFSIVNTQDTVPSLTDRAGNPLASGKTAETYKICFTGLTCSGSSIGNVAVITSSITQPASTADTTGPSAPAAVTATLTDDLKVKLTWTDPTATDFSTIKIYKTVNDGIEMSLDTVSKGTKTFTDNKVIEGEKVKYRLSGFDMSGNEGAKSDYLSIEVKEAAVAEPINVTLSEQNNSGQSGTATIEEVTGGLKVTLALTGGPTGVSQPAHIHNGSCAEVGDAKYTLTSVSGGASETTLDLTLDELKAGYPLAINVHKSTEEAGTYYACGDIEATETLEEVALAEVIAVETTVPETGIVAEEVTLQDADSGASLTIGAETTATVVADDGTAVAYTGTIASPKVDAEQTVVAPTGTEAVTEVFDVDTGVTTSVTFDTPVTLVLPAKGEVDLDKIYTLYTVDETTGELSQPVECTVKTSGEDKVFECEVTHLTKFVVLASEPEEEVVAEEEEEEMPFVDVNNHWSKDYVTDLYNQGVVSGKDLTHFKPDDSITRAEFTKVIVGAFGIEIKDAEDISVMPFKDVKASNWYLPYVEAAKEEGLVGGYSDGTFKPDATITRAEAMKILLEAAGVDLEGAEKSTFKDVDQKAWYAGYVNYAAENDVVKGYADGTFGVNKNITRAETAKIVSIMMAE